MKTRVMTPRYKRKGLLLPPVATEYEVDVVPGKSIQIYRHGVAVNRYEIGDSAEYDSYNLSYYGKIVAITNKNVTICYGSRNHRLNLYQFCWRNYDFNLSKAAADNADTMMYI